MQRLLAVVKSKWFITLIGVIALSLLIWFGSPFISVAGKQPFESLMVRGGLIGLIIVIWLISNLEISLRSKKSNEGLVAEIAASKAGGKTIADTGSEAGILEQRMLDALTLLKKAKMADGQKLYEMPWYVIIGPPGAGKTTALTNSGLQFPLAEQLGKDPIQGIGGTRHCDWYFTDQAVLIDTAGRYTTQDSNSEVDGSAWNSFIQLLRKYRPRRPLNGVIIALSLAELALQTEPERNLHAQAIKKRLQELQEQLNMRLPVYIMLTKSDMIAGFSEFFDHLTREEREEVFGVTFPLHDSEVGNTIPTQFNTAFAALLQHIGNRIMPSLQNERDTEKRAAIFEFPRQLATLQEPLTQLLQQLSAPSRFEQPAMIRGIYFASAIQNGTPVDRIMRNLAGAIGLTPKHGKNQTRGTRGYFLLRMIRDVMIAERDLAGSNRAFEKRRKMLLGLAYGSLFALLVSGGGLCYFAYTQNQKLSENLHGELQTYRDSVGTGLTPTTDLAVLNQSLQVLRDLPGGYSHRSGRTLTSAISLGLYQGARLGEQAEQIYKQALQQFFLATLKYRLESQLADSKNDLSFTYEALKAYLMLYNREHLAIDELRLWLGLDWERALPGEANSKIRDQLGAHLAAALEENIPMPPKDADIVAAARKALTQMPLSERVYRRIKQEFLDGPVPPFKITDVTGSIIGNVFVRKSGKSFDEGIPGLFTYNGYHGVFRLENERISKRLTDESWILGEQEQAQLDDEGLKKLSQEVEQRYFEEYIAQWDGLIGDLQLASFKDSYKATEMLRALAGQDSLLKKILVAVEKNTSLTKLPAADAAPKAVDDKLKAEKERLARLLPQNMTNKAIKLPGEEVEQHFEPINRLVRSAGGGPMPIDSTLGVLNDVYNQFSAITTAGNSGQAAFQGAKDQSQNNSAVMARIQQVAAEQPPIVKTMLQQVASSGGKVATDNARSYLNELWGSQVKPHCGITQRYPINKNAAQEATLMDFGKFFGFGGVMDTFFNENVKPFVDMSQTKWRWRTEIGIPDSVLAQFQRAQRIREVFFAAGQQIPAIQFSLKPVDLDNNVSQFLLDLNGQQLTYRHGPSRNSALEWPGKDSTDQTRIVFTPPDGGLESSQLKDGPWGWFRLLDGQTISPTAQPDRFNVAFQSGGYIAKFELRANSVDNPFRLDALHSFRCPDQL